MKKQAPVSIKSMKANSEVVAGVLKALAHPQRLLILCNLIDGEKTVGELENLCEASQSSISQFLKLLRLEGLVESEKRGLYVYYKIKDPKVNKLIRALYKLYCKTL